MSIAVVLVAAGKGERLGAEVPKAFVNLAGKSLLAHALASMRALKNLGQIVVAVPKEYVATTQHLLVESGLVGQLDVVVGGVTRQASIANALLKINTENAVTLVHDVARCLASANLFERVANQVLASRTGVVPTLSVIDTIKRIDGDHILETVDRSSLAIAQTPQGFLTNELLAAYQVVEHEYTDDASLYQAFGKAVTAIEGEPNAFKITTADDLARATRLLNSELRTGIGTDSHRFGQTGTLQLACIEWPDTPALEGHSDGDAVAHAIVDALLASAGLGDIGSIFGVDRPEFAGATGERFLKETLNMLQNRGLSIVNVSVQVISNRPRIGPRRTEAEARLSEILGAPVSVGATTTDGLGFLGNSEGLAAVATALVSGSSFTAGEAISLDRLGS